MNANDNQVRHALRFPARQDSLWRVVYRNGGSVVTEADANQADVELFVAGGGYTRVAMFPLPGSKAGLEQCLQTFQRIFDAGKRARSREIADFLGD